MIIREIVAFFFFLLTLLFGLSGILGLFRFNGIYEKIQSISLLGTTSVLSMFIGLLILSKSWLFATRLGIIILFFLISSPTATYIITRLYWKNITGETKL